MNCDNSLFDMFVGCNVNSLNESTIDSLLTSLFIAKLDNKDEIPRIIQLHFHLTH